MFATRLNELRVKIEIAPAPESAILIKEGRHREGGKKTVRSFHPSARRDPPRPRRREGRGYADYDSDDESFDMACVWTHTANGPRFYLPGSSLRGALRSAAERLVGRWQPGWTLASDPFRNAAQTWVLDEREQERNLSGADIYRIAGPIERCFGHTALRGRWTIGDAILHDNHQARVIVRDGVGINRQTGAARESIKFQFEAIAGGIFETTIVLVNYELWQIGLLAHLLAALDAGAIRLGYGERRGLGRARLAVTYMEWRWYGLAPSPAHGDVQVPPLADLARRAGITGDYGWRDADQVLLLPLEEAPDALIGSVWRASSPRLAPDDGFAQTDWDAPLWARPAALLAETLEGWAPPAERRAHLQR